MSQFTASRLLHSVRLKVLALALGPLLAAIPLILLAREYWMEDQIRQQLLYRVSTDLHVARRTFLDLQERYLRQATRLAESHAFVDALSSVSRSHLQYLLADTRDSAGFDYLHLHAAPSGAPPVAPRFVSGNLATRLDTGQSLVTLQVLDGRQLEALSEGLASRAATDLLPTPQARPLAHHRDERGMVIRVLLPLQDTAGRNAGILDGGVLLNGHNGFVDSLRDLVYSPGSLPQQVRGTATLFLDDIRVATNVLDAQGNRAVGTRASAEVHRQVIEMGGTWIDRAFVVDAWYIAGYTPLVDAAGQRIGMLYTGFSERPFIARLRVSQVTTLLGILVLGLVSGLLLARGARSIFHPLEKMIEVVSANRQGRSLRIGTIGARGELASLAQEIDRLLNSVQAAARDNRRLALVARHTHNAVIVTDPHWCVTWVNPGFEKLSGYSLEQCRGRHPGEVLYGPDTDPGAVARIDKAVANQEPVQLDLVNRHHDGEAYWVAMDMQPVFDEAGRMTGFIVVQSEITERVRAQQELERQQAQIDIQRRFLDTVVNQLPMAASVKLAHDDGYRYRLWNRFAEKLFGLDAQAAIGQRDQDLFDVELATDQTEWERETLARNSLNVIPEYRLRGNNGGNSILQIRQVPIAAGDDTPALLTLYENISERKRVDAKLREQASQLTRANRELQRLSQIKDRFLANMSHELRTPLNAVLAIAEVLQEGVYGPLTDKQAEYLATVERSGRHLLSLINDILDLSKIDAGRMPLNLEPVAVSRLCEAALDLVRDLAQRNSVRLTEESVVGDTTIQVDRRRMVQVLVNLLSNAIKFTRSAGDAGLRVTRTADGLAFEVWDQGPGIAAEDRDKLFQPFVQLDSGLEHQQQGTGLGLVLVRELSALHGGRVELDSSPSGSCFRVILPQSVMFHGEAVGDVDT